MTNNGQKKNGKIEMIEVANCSEIWQKSNNQINNGQ